MFPSEAFLWRFFQYSTTAVEFPPPPPPPKKKKFNTHTHTHNPPRYFLASNWKSSAHSHVCLLLASEEHEKAGLGDAFDTLTTYSGCVQNALIHHTTSYWTQNDSTHGHAFVTFKFTHSGLVMRSLILMVWLSWHSNQRILALSWAQNDSSHGRAFISSMLLYVHRDHKDYYCIRDGGCKTAISSFAQFQSSVLSQSSKVNFNKQDQKSSVKLMCGFKKRSFQLISTDRAYDVSSLRIPFNMWWLGSG